jgi:hypothetical protein
VHLAHLGLLVALPLPLALLAPARQPEPLLPALDPHLDPLLPQVPPRLLVLLTACKSVPRSLVSLVSLQLSLPCKWDRIEGIPGMGMSGTGDGIAHDQKHLMYLANFMLLVVVN